MDENAWQRAQNLQDLADATCSWLRGEGPAHPLGGDAPDTETMELVEYLLRINRAGLVTTFSQPAYPIHEGSGQRAAVEGICNEGLAKRLYTLTLWTDLVVVVHEPAFEGGHYLPITTDNYHPFTWIGRFGRDELVGPFEDRGCSSIIPVLRQSWKVAALDPQWGRAEYLWECLVELTEAEEPPDWQSAPSPELQLGVDFIT